jgi:sugar lactone lactonase YvrE
LSVAELYCSPRFHAPKFVLNYKTNDMKKIILFAILGLQLTCSIAQNVSTLAGSGVLGSADGTGNQASFNNPGGIAVDASGNVYVADQTNHKIRKITSAGVVTTFAGSGVAATVDGTGTAASFNFPTGIAIDATGNLFVAEFYGHRVRMITPAGVVTTFVGSGAMGSADGTGAAASFYNPADITIDIAGNLYVSDYNNHKIRKITPAGVVTSLAGSGASGNADGTGAAASFFQPLGLCCDLAGNIYVADYSNNIIRKITPGGVVTTIAGSGGYGGADGQGTSATFAYPYDLAVDVSGNLFVTQSSGMVRKISPSNMVTTHAGFFSTTGSMDGPAATATFYWPQGIAIDAAGNLFITEQGNHDIRKITSISGIQSENDNFIFSLFPNPTTSTLTIQTEEMIENITIYNLMGAAVQTETKNIFSVAELPAGVYLLRLQTTSGISTSRFVKE